MLVRYVKCAFDPPNNPNLSASFQQHVVEKDIQVVNFPVVLVGIWILYNCHFLVHAPIAEKTIMQHVKLLTFLHAGMSFTK